MAGTANSGGRNAKSPAEHRTIGTFQPSRHEGFETPDPPKGQPVPPRPLSSLEKAEWNRMVLRMEDSKTSSRVDDAVLYQYVQLFGEGEALRAANLETRRLSKALKKAARKLEGKELVQAIQAIVSLEFLSAKNEVACRQNHLAIKQYLVELGMTPSARTRVKIHKEVARTSKLVAFMGGKTATT